MRILIVQSVDTWIDILKNLVNVKYKEIANCFSYTDSFDNAVDLVESTMKDEELYVITSEMFHDNFSTHRETSSYRIPESLKCASNLARLVKDINPKAKVFCYSQLKPSADEFLDGFIKKNDSDTSGIERLIENISHQD